MIHGERSGTELRGVLARSIHFSLVAKMGYPSFQHQSSRRDFTTTYLCAPFSSIFFAVGE